MIIDCRIVRLTSPTEVSNAVSDPGGGQDVAQGMAGILWAQHSLPVLFLQVLYRGLAMRCGNHDLTRRGPSCHHCNEQRKAWGLEC